MIMTMKTPKASRPDSELTKDAIFLQPWFLPIEVYREVRRLLPYIHLFKMRYYFDDYGCLKCGKKDALYQSNGLCESCGVVVRHRVRQALMRRLKKVGIKATPGYIPPDAMARAEQLLSTLKTK